MFRVVRRFKELKHDGHIYQVGDTYPKEGSKATKTRLEELTTGKNKYKQVYIEEVVEENAEKVTEEVSQEIADEE
ncbi:hypothetical protein [Paenibacillus sp. 32O-W]|uniref:hypothetical protein n=1 Tax=Paenibacillus sp. 32O-W TaxID=1695218 RepID=UPI001643099A|nr:hypothetical protein [Paenibacillus sp. 32O-W]